MNTSIKTTIPATTTADANNWSFEHPKVQRFIKDFLNPWKQFLFMFTRLPGAMFFGVRVKQITENMGVVTLPYGWRSQNPFKSIYFAAQMSAGEMSTGILVLMALQGQPPVSMLVLDIRAKFYKKATTKINFTCNQGAEAVEVVQKAIQTNTPQTLTMNTVGKDINGNVVSEVFVTWTFKKRSKK